METRHDQLPQKHHPARLGKGRSGRSDRGSHHGFNGDGMTFLFPLLLKIGIPQRLLAPVQYAVLAIVAVLGLLAAKALYDASVVEDHVQKRAIETIEARDDAADERAEDAIRNTTNDKDRTNAIDNAPEGGDLSPAALRLNCERLRQRGGLSAAVRRKCGYGEEAGAD